MIGGPRASESPEAMARALGYDPLWRESGLLSDDELREQYEVLLTGEDTGTEHYRYGQFRRLVDGLEAVRDDDLDRILRLALVDPDPVMAEAVAIELISIAPSHELLDFLEQRLPADFETARRQLSEYRILLPLRHGSRQREDLLRAARSGSRRVHLYLADLLSTLPTKIVAILAEDGATKAVRNRSRQELASTSRRC